MEKLVERWLQANPAWFGEYALRHLDSATVDRWQEAQRQGGDNCQPPKHICSVCKSERLATALAGSPSLRRSAATSLGSMGDEHALSSSLQGRLNLSTPFSLLSFSTTHNRRNATATAGADLITKATSSSSSKLYTRPLLALESPRKSEPSEIWLSGDYICYATV